MVDRVLFNSIFWLIINEKSQYFFKRKKKKEKRKKSDLTLITYANWRVISKLLNFFLYQFITIVAVMQTMFNLALK
jgi:hypothetical protein